MWRDQLMGNLNCHSFKFCIFILVALIVTVQFFIAKESDCTEALFASTSFESDTLSKEAGCVLRNYSVSKSRSCFEKVKERQSWNYGKLILFVGSRHLLSLYEDFLNQVGVNVKVKEGDTVPKNIEINDLGLHVRYIPLEFSGSSLQELLKEWRNGIPPPDLVVLNFHPSSSGRSPGAISRWMDSLVNNVSAMRLDLDLLAQRKKIVWTIFDFGYAEKKFKSLLTNALKGTHVHLWEVAERRRQLASKPARDSFQYETQALLNYFCNGEEEQPTPNLCCSASPTSLFVIKMVLVSCVVVGFGVLFFFTFYYSWNSILDTFEETFSSSCSHMKFLRLDDGSAKNAPLDVLPPESVSEKKEKFPNQFFVPFVKCVVIFSYFYFCDRTNLFLKEKKDFTFDKFFVPLLVSVVISLGFREKTSKSTVLNREITDEWKGWMQIVLLIYHYTGASSYVHIYMYVRVLVSSYLFMTGFGNFCYYWNGGELSFRRYCQVMLRLNFLTVVLCLVMKRQYVAYYFVPLVSFWYTALFLLLRIPPHLTLNSEGKRATESTTKDYIIVTTKLLFFSGLITGLSTSKDVFDSVFLLPVIRALFTLPGHADEEWWFRWHLDKYSIVYGAFFGVIYMKMTQPQVSKEVKDKQLHLKTGVIMTVGVTLLLAYSSLFFFCDSKYNCNVIHPYISWIPIIGYILFRNASEEIRSSCSSVMLAAGKISLELFVGQYHIWLASDARGILVLIPWANPVVNMIFTSVVFVCVAHELNSVTGELTALLFPKDNRTIIRNLVILFLGGFVVNVIL